MKQTIIMALLMISISSFAFNKQLKASNERLQEENLDLTFAYDDAQSELSEYKYIEKLMVELKK